ncbi:MAG: hypothetical protein J7621_16210 [Niastella sp.]|nr:hypothetical protein [Niastella sp.]
MKIHTLVILCWVLCFCTFCSLAQDKEAISITYGVSRLHYHDTAAGMRQLEVKARLPLLHQGGNMLVVGMNYKLLSPDDLPAAYGDALHGASVQVAWIARLNERKSLTVFAQAGLFSDMQDISAKDLRYGLGIRYRVRHSDKLATGWGLGYSRQFFGNQLVPFIDLQYMPNQHWSISGQFPIKPKVLYHFNDQVAVGLEVSGDGSSYRLSHDKNNDQFVQVNQWAALARLEYRFASSWLLTLGLGSNLRQSYRLYNDASNIPWTIITVPLGDRDAPVQEIKSRGLQLQVGFAFSPFR